MFKTPLDKRKAKQRTDLGVELVCGIKPEILDEMKRVMKKINIYIWCSKSQIKGYLNTFDNCNMELLTWHKTNPIPTCNNSYLPDTEYLLFFREKGVKVYGTVQTKRKYYVSSLNVADKKRYGHPTIKPLHIIENLIINSSQENDTVLDPFLGSGTTAVAAIKTNRRYIGFEINPEYFAIAEKRIEDAKSLKSKENEEQICISY